MATDPESHAWQEVVTSDNMTEVTFEIQLGARSCDEDRGARRVKGKETQGAHHHSLVDDRGHHTFAVGAVVLANDTLICRG
jgi:hypothetical protein